MTTANLLSLRGLGIEFGGLVAVDQVDFELPASHITCIIGPNGAGKSTLFNLITGIYKPSSSLASTTAPRETVFALYKNVALKVMRVP